MASTEPKGLPADWKKQLNDYEQIKRMLNPDQVGLAGPDTPVAQRLLEFFWTYPKTEGWLAGYLKDKPTL